MLTEIDFDKLTETQIEPIYTAWLDLPENNRTKMEQDFQEIDTLATEGGSKAILDEAEWHDEDLAEQFAKLDGFYERAFWTFLERSDYWHGAVIFNHSKSPSPPSLTSPPTGYTDWLARSVSEPSAYAKRK